MSIQILDILIEIKQTYGEAIFSNAIRMNNVLMDLAPCLRKERLQVRNILELGGYNEMKNTVSYTLTRNKLINDYSEWYCVDLETAAWVVDLLGAVLGHVLADEVRELKSGRGVSPSVGRKYQHCIDAGAFHTVVLLSDGTVLATGDNEAGQCNVSDWHHIVAVYAGSFHTIGVRQDGTVVATGDNSSGQCEVSGWTDIVSVAASSRHTVGLRANGRVVATGRNAVGECDLSFWRDISFVAAGAGCTIGIRKNQTVLTAPSPLAGTAVLKDLVNVVSIAGDYKRGILAVQNDGTIIRKRGLLEGMSHTNFIRKQNIKSVAMGNDFFVGLKNDGTVRLLEFLGKGLEVAAAEIATWTDIIAMAAGGCHIIGLRADGSLLATMTSLDEADNENQCEVFDWNHVGIPIFL